MNKRSCTDQAYLFLSLRDHNRKELEIKLKEKGYESVEITETLEYLSKNGSLDEERYVESFIRSNNRKHPEGKSVILQRLAQKGADREISRSVVERIYTDEYIQDLIMQDIYRIKKKDIDIPIDILKNKIVKSGFSYFDISKAFEMANLH